MFFINIGVLLAELCIDNFISYHPISYIFTLNLSEKKIYKKQMLCFRDTDFDLPANCKKEFIENYEFDKHERIYII